MPIYSPLSVSKRLQSLNLELWLRLWELDGHAVTVCPSGTARNALRGTRIKAFG